MKAEFALSSKIQNGSEYGPKLMVSLSFIPVNLAPVPDRFLKQNGELSTKWYKMDTIKAFTVTGCF
jgi:hypothetical protein